MSLFYSFTGIVNYTRREKQFSYEAQIHPLHQHWSRREDTQGKATAHDLATDACLGASPTHKGPEPSGFSGEEPPCFTAQSSTSMVTSEGSHPIGGITCVAIMPKVITQPRLLL